MIKVRKYNLGEKFVDIVATFNSDSGKEKNTHVGPLENDYRKEENDWERLTQDQRDEFNKIRSIQRTKTKVRRLVISQKLRYMWTLTFSSQTVQVKDKLYNTGVLDDVWTLWKAFIKRCKRVGLDFKYVVTVELQEKRKERTGEKVYHFHFATDTYIPFNAEIAQRHKLNYDIQMLWGKQNGYALVSSSKKRGSFAHLYLMKYITKMFDEAEKGSHRYRCSRGMEIPCEEKMFENELALDLYVKQIADVRGCTVHKEYYPLNNGANEVLVYILLPFKKNKKKRGKKDDKQNGSSSAGQIAI